MAQREQLAGATAFMDLRRGGRNRSMQNGRIDVPRISDAPLRARHFVAAAHDRSFFSESLLSLRSMTRASMDFLPNVKDEPHGRLARGVRQHDS
jgi:hypothetical protein